MTDVVTAKDAGGNVVNFGVSTGSGNVLVPLGALATVVEDGSITPISADNALPVTDAAAETSLATIATAQGAQGTGLTPPTGGTGLLGFLSGIYHALLGTLTVGGSVEVSNFPSSQPVSGTVTANAGTNLNTSALALETGGNLATVATETTAAAAAIGTITDAPADAPATSTPATQISLLKKIVNLLNGTLGVSGTFWQATQPVSAVSLPLPTGAATSSKQPALGAAGTPATDVLTVQGITSMTALKVDGSGVTQPVSAASLPLPTGASTSANQSTANTSLATIATNTTGASTAALQTTGNTSAATTATNTGTIAGAVTSSVIQSNTKQVNGVTTLAGAGAVGTGAQRVAVGQDTTTIAGSAPGTAGTPSTNVITVQGPTSGGTALPVSAASLPLPTGAATSANQTSQITQETAIATATAGLNFASNPVASITRSANTTTYTALTGWNNGTPTFFSFTGAGRVNGGSVLITGIDIHSSANPTTKLTGNLWLFSGVPGTNVGDNSNFNIASADFANLTGGSLNGISFALGSSQGSGASNSGVSLTNTTYQAKCPSGTTTLTGMVEVTNTYVPASEEVLTISLNIVGLN